MEILVTAWLASSDLLHYFMKFMTGWFAFNFIMEMAPLIINIATHCHTTESVEFRAYIMVSYILAMSG